MRYDALVIGAGMSGLAAGIRLAQAGKRVAVLERHYLWGGLNSFYKRAGRRFDTGLHALTNYVARGTAGAPLTKVLRQLRIPYDALRLAPQGWSETVVRAGGDLLRLRFGNGLELLRSEVERLFPGRGERLDRLVAELPPYVPASDEAFRVPARARVREIAGDPLLSEMLLVAPTFYGGSSEDGLCWGDFGVLFRSIHLEGLARPEGGIKTLLDALVARYREAGGELRMRCGVRSIAVDGGAARGVVLDSGEELEAEQVFSSAGALETRALCGAPVERERDAGRLSFFETCSVLDRAPRELGHDATITFFVDGPELRYRRPEGLVDVSSGVVTTPNNYAQREPLPEGCLRVTVLANHARWTALDEAAYREEKARALEAVLASAARFAFDPRPHTVAADAFTPRTIERYTGHFGGAVYGSPRKSRDGASGVAHLHLIGTDQGLVGVVGALLSGITVANREALVPQGGGA
jgi:phytoene dehydrogenase-like protein